MLVLTRKTNEIIMIGDSIKIQILPNNRPGDKVRIGIEAPANISVHREEVYNRLQAEKAWAENEKI